ncbi:hypothetical protein CZ787_05240 [Halomonas citrativorans]|uniref:Uncharacterized protein n=1 Tax=Halomonas citrativorans TaxID=2742612 RepID=A0A1R4HU90_9GAMM|nr:hypothetical protein CZ787_05240 [Halomonas citrativorans]
MKALHPQVVPSVLPNQTLADALGELEKQLGVLLLHQPRKAY